MGHDMREGEFRHIDPTVPGLHKERSGYVASVMPKLGAISPRTGADLGNHIPDKRLLPVV